MNVRPGGAPDLVQRGEWPPFGAGQAVDDNDVLGTNGQSRVTAPGAYDFANLHEFRAVPAMSRCRVERVDNRHLQVGEPSGLIQCQKSATVSERVARGRIT